MLPCSLWIHSPITCLMQLLFSSPVGMGSQHLVKELSEKIYFYHSHTFAEATKGTYRTYRKACFQFCEFMGFDPLPATTVIICQYAAFLAKLSSIRNYITIISLLHKKFSLPNLLQDSWVIRSLLQGIKSVKGGEISQKLHITLDIYCSVFIPDLISSIVLCNILGSVLSGLLWSV